MTVLYHGAPIEQREQILQQGLKLNIPNPGEGYENLPQGIYLAADPEEAGYFNSDIWEVNIDGLPIEIDPNSYNQNGVDDNYYTTQPISPDRLTLLDNLHTEDIHSHTGNDIKSRLTSGMKMAMPRNTLIYHCAPASQRASISQHGVDPSKAPYDRSTNEPGFYAFSNLEEAQWYAEYMAMEQPIEPFDIWEVRPTILDQDQDYGLLMGDSEPGSEIYHQESVPAENIRLIMTFNPHRGWQKQSADEPQEVEITDYDPNYFSLEALREIGREFNMPYVPGFHIDESGRTWSWDPHGNVYENGQPSRKLSVPFSVQNIMEEERGKETLKELEKIFTSPKEAKGPKRHKRVEDIAGELGWKEINPTANRERRYEWYDEQSNRHIVQVGSGTHGETAKIYDATKGRQRMLRCMDGTCSHRFEMGEEINPEVTEEDTSSFNPGDLVIYNGSQYWILEKTGDLVTLYDDQGQVLQDAMGQDEIVPVSELQRFAKTAETLAPVMPDINNVLDYNPEDQIDPGWRSYIWWTEFKLPIPHDLAKEIFSPEGISWEQARDFLLRSAASDVKEVIIKAVPEQDFKYRYPDRFPNNGYVEFVIEKVTWRESKTADYFYDWQGYYPDDGSLDDGVISPEGPSPAFVNMPCRQCGKPNHLINIDQYNEQDHALCDHCRSQFDMKNKQEPNALEYTDTSWHSPWQVMNKYAEYQGIQGYWQGAEIPEVIYSLNIVAEGNDNVIFIFTSFTENGIYEEAFKVHALRSLSATAASGEGVWISGEQEGSADVITIQHKGNQTVITLDLGGVFVITKGDFDYALGRLGSVKKSEEEWSWETTEVDNWLNSEEGIYNMIARAAGSQSLNELAQTIQSIFEEYIGYNQAFQVDDPEWNPDRDGDPRLIDWIALAEEWERRDEEQNEYMDSPPQRPGESDYLPQDFNKSSALKCPYCGAMGMTRYPSKGYSQCMSCKRTFEDDVLFGRKPLLEDPEPTGELWENHFPEEWLAKVANLSPMEEQVVASIYQDNELFHQVMEIFNGLMYQPNNDKTNYDFYVNSVKEVILDWYPHLAEEDINWQSIYVTLDGFAYDYFEKMDNSPSDLALPQSFGAAWRPDDPMDPTDRLIQQVQEDTQRRRQEEQAQQQPTQFPIPQKAIDMSLYKHRCMQCGGYLRQQGEYYQCENCPWHWPKITSDWKSKYDYQKATTAKDCGSCAAFIKGRCDMFKAKVEAEMVCDEWTDEWPKHTSATMTSMAERTGDPQLDKLIEKFINHEMPWNDGEDMLPINAMKDPLEAEGMCGDITTAFQAFVWHETGGRLYPENVEMTDGSFNAHSPSFEQMGYGDRKPGEQGHLVSQITMPSGTYTIDWTAAQYGYKEFPMVQKLDGDQWQREWTAAASQVMYHSAPSSARDSIQQYGIDHRIHFGDERVRLVTQEPHTGAEPRFKKQPEEEPDQMDLPLNTLWERSPYTQNPPRYTWEQINDMLEGQPSKKVQRNTWLERLDDNSIGLKLHDTHVLKYYPDYWEPYTGGWNTMTTWQRINNWAPVGSFAKPGNWGRMYMPPYEAQPNIYDVQQGIYDSYWPNKGNPYPAGHPYSEGMKIDYNGQLYDPERMGSIKLADPFEDIIQESFGGSDLGQMTTIYKGIPLGSMNFSELSQTVKNLKGVIDRELQFDIGDGWTDIMQAAYNWALGMDYEGWAVENYDQQPYEGAIVIEAVVPSYAIKKLDEIDGHMVYDEILIEPGTDIRLTIAHFYYVDNEALQGGGEYEEYGSVSLNETRIASDIFQQYPEDDPHDLYKHNWEQNSWEYPPVGLTCPFCASDDISESVIPAFDAPSIRPPKIQLCNQCENYFDQDKDTGWASHISSEDHDEDPYKDWTSWFTDHNDPQKRDLTWMDHGGPAFITRPNFGPKPRYTPAMQDDFLPFNNYRKMHDQENESKWPLDQGDGLRMV